MTTRPAAHPGAAALLIANAITACTGGAGTGSFPAGASDSASPVATPVPATPTPSPLLASLEPPTTIPGTTDTIPGAYVKAAIADAAARAGVVPANVTVISTEAHDWPNGALGCPVLGYLYAEMITPGYRIVVEAGGTTYDYRAAARGAGEVRLCENPLDADPQAPG